MQTAVVALIAVTVFIRTKMPKQTGVDGEIFMGALFFAILRLMFSGLAEIVITVTELPVFYKQRDLLFYPAWTYSLPKWILKIPISVIEAGTWVLLTYYAIFYDHDLGRFFKHWLLLLALHQMASGLYRFVAGVSRKMVVASTLGSLVLSIYLILGGFVLSRGKRVHKNIKFMYNMTYRLKRESNVFLCCRCFKEMVDMGLLVLSSDVCPERYGGKRIPWEKLEPCKITSSHIQVHKECIMIDFKSYKFS